MKSTLSILLAIGVAALVATQLRSSVGQQGQSEPNLFGPAQEQAPELPVLRAPRRLPYEAGVDIRSRIRADDSSIELVSGSAPPLYDVPGDRTVIEANTAEADVVAVIRVTGKRGALAPAQDWVHSQISAAMVTALKNISPENPEVGRTVEFTDPSGGALMIGPVRVSARVDGTVPLEPGETYLVFFQQFGGALFVPPDQRFLVKEGRLHSGTRGSEDVAGLLLDDAMAQVISTRDMRRKGARQ